MRKLLAKAITIKECHAYEPAMRKDRHIGPTLYLGVVWREKIR